MMTKHVSHFTIINDDAAEGSAGTPVETLEDRAALLAEDRLPERPETRAVLNNAPEASASSDGFGGGASTDQNAEGLDANGSVNTASLRQSMVIPALRFDLQRSPSGETGIIAIVTAGENDETDDTQDASQTVDEISALIKSAPISTVAATIPRARLENTSDGFSDSSGQAGGSQPTMAPQPDPSYQDDTMREPLVGSALIVEDTPEVSELLDIVLRRMGLNTASESHGAKAFTRFTELQPDLVLLDLALPDIHGWKVLDAIKEQHRIDGGKMPVVIVLTAYGDAANRLVGKLQGVHSYLIKPFTVEEVERTIWNALGQAAN